MDHHEVLSEKLSEQVTPEYAIREAMTYTLAWEFECERPADFAARFDPRITMFEHLRKETQDECSTVFFVMYHYLTAKYRECFEYLIPVGINETEEHKFRNKSWKRNGHVVLIAKARQNEKWYACSPSNYVGDERVPGVEEPYNRLTSIITADSLDEILIKMAVLEGGVWPTAKTVLCNAMRLP